MAVGFALAQAIALMAPRRIVIGGGVLLIGVEWFDGTSEHSWTTLSSPFPAAAFVSSRPPSGSEVVVHGALSGPRPVDASQHIPRWIGQIRPHGCPDSDEIPIV